VDDLPGQLAVQAWGKGAGAAGVVSQQRAEVAEQRAVTFLDPEEAA